jgi:hypothetical protein
MKKLDFRARVMKRRRFAWSFWPKLVIASITVFFLTVFVLVPYILIDHVMAKTMKDPPDLEFILGFSGFSVPGLWAVTTLERLDRNTDQEFMLSLFED